MQTFARLLSALLVLAFLLVLVPFPGQAQKKKYPESAYPEHYRLVFPKLIPYRAGNLWGYADSTGVLKIKPQYAYAEPFENGFAVVHKNEKANLINEAGKEIFSWQFRHLYIWNNRLVFAETSQRLYGAYNLAGQEILPPEYRSASSLKYNDTRLPALIAAWKEQPPVPGPGGFSTSGPTQITSLFTENGKLLLPDTYEGIQYVGGGIIQAYKARTFYHFDEQGKPLPAFQGYKVVSYSKGVAVIFKDQQYGLADSTGKILAVPQYEDAKEFREGKLAVKSKGSWGFIDQSGKALTPFKYAEPGYFMSGFAIVQTGRNAYGIIDSLGQEVTPFTFSYIYGAKPGEIYAFNTNNVVRYGLRRKDSGKIEIYDDISEIKYFNEGLAIAIKNGKKGYLDENGKTVIPFEYAESMPLKNGLAAVHNGKNWGVVNRQNETVIPFLYEGLEVINPDRFIVWLFNRPAWFMKALMNAKGEEITPLKYTDISQPELDRIMVGVGPKWGFINSNGREILPLMDMPAGYTPDGSFKNGIQKLVNKKLNKTGYRDWKGRHYFKD